MQPDHKLPMGILTGGSKAVHDHYAKFHFKVMQDGKNEKFPVNSRKLSSKTRQVLQLGN